MAQAEAWDARLVVVIHLVATLTSEAAVAVIRAVPGPVTEVAAQAEPVAAAVVGAEDSLANVQDEPSHHQAFAVWVHVSV